MTSSLAVPIVTPRSIEFYLDDKRSLKQHICILNPFSFHTLFTVDVTSPICNISPRQGVLNSRSKIFLQITCTSKRPAQDGVQVRFFKVNGPPRHGQLSKKFLGYRTIQINVRPSIPSEEDRETTSSEQDTVVPPGTPRSGATSVGGSTAGTVISQGYRKHRESFQNGHQEAHNSKVKLYLFLAVALLLGGLALGQADPTWFKNTLPQGCTPHTCAVICYTLSVVLFVQVATHRR